MQAFRSESEKDSSYGFSFLQLTAPEQRGGGSSISQWVTQGEQADVWDDN